MVPGGWPLNGREKIEQRNALLDVPNALGFQRIIETDTNGYLVRQYVHGSLYDRLSTRPFLEDIEKKWLAYQLLCGLRDCHARDIYHGDIKAQNIVVTSWNWLYLTDFSSAFKPVELPANNPGDFSYYFDTSGRRTCYIAPERFYESQPTRPKMTWAMDIFSAGCVIAQMFLESEIFSLAQLYKYRKGEYDPVITHLSMISDKDVRDMITHMIQLDPEKRYSADQYLEFWKGKVFPGYFYHFLHQYVELITDPSSGNSPMSGASKNLGEADDRIDRVFYDFDKISYFLGYHQERNKSDQKLLPKLGLSHFPVQLNIPNHEHVVSAELEPPEDDGTLLFLTIIVSSMRTTARASSRIRACDVLLAFAERITDEAKLDRVLPYLVSLLNKEESDLVVICAIRTITQLLALVRMVTPINAHVMVEYVLPRMELALGSKQKASSPLVRATYASCLGSLASTSQRFLEMASSLKADGSMPITDPELEPGAAAEANFESVFDNAATQLLEVLERHVKQLVEDPDVHVRRAFLASVPELCMFFQEESNDILLTHLNTYLNGRDWALKCSFFETIVGIAVFIGSTSLQEFMLPLMIQALMDPEEQVIQAALHSLAQIAGLGLLSRMTVWELSEIVARFTMHPNIWIREASAEFLSSALKYSQRAETASVFLPIIQPYVQYTVISNTSELGLLDALKKPLPRPVFEQALLWASQTNRGLFWKPMQKLRSSTFGTSGLMGSNSGGDVAATSMSKVPRNEEDEQWLAKLRNIGMKTEDEPKLLALREFIWRLSQMRSKEALSGNVNESKEFVSLQELGVTLNTIFWNEELMEDPNVVDHLNAPPELYTIADALLDASMTIDDGAGKKKHAAANTHKARVHSVGPKPSQSGRLLSPLGHGRASSMDARASSANHALSDDAASITSTKDGSYASRRAVRHQSSALNLLDRKGSNKSIAETGMADANATGQVEGPFAQGQPAETAADKGEALKVVPRISKHSYEGGDPNIQKMLDNIFIDTFPRDIVEFGPFVQPASQRPITNAAPPTGDSIWKPSGSLVATFCEHRGPITRVVASPDHVFFITGSSDGTVKVWDAGRLERNITTRSRQTHSHAEGSQVTALCFIETSHCFVSCANDGIVHVVKVDTAFASGVVRYGKLRILREYRLPDGQYATWCENIKHEGTSVLLVSTNKSNIIGIDLRKMKILYTLKNPLHHGMPTCFCVDKRRNWLVVGTSHGVVDLWDLRFKMRLKAWGVPGKGFIYRMCIHPTKGRGKWICISGGTGQGEVTVWDLERVKCREIYRTSGGKDSSKGYEAWEVDEDKPESMLGRFATNVEYSEAVNADRGVRAMIIGCEAGEDTDVRHAFIVTGGSDKRLRFWDLAHPENSCVFSGLQADEPKPSYTCSNPVSMLTLTAEKFAKQNTPAANTKSSKSAGGRTPRSTVISSQQQQLLQSHMDLITDVALLEFPYSMSVSVDRSGVVFVFR